MAKPKISIIHEHPALFLGELHDDMERIYAEDTKGNRYDIKIIDGENEPQIVHETLVSYPNDLVVELADE